MGKTARPEKPVSRASTGHVRPIRRHSATTRLAHLYPPKWPSFSPPPTYNTGARVQEVVDVTVGAVRFNSPPIVSLKGKGSKTRIVPLWPTTATSLLDHLKQRGIEIQKEAHLFVNARGGPLTRFGVRHILRTRVASVATECASLAGKRISPHTFRHSTAMHLLQAGVDLTVIQRWLGHVQLATTRMYVEIDLEMKRKALAACTPPVDAANGLRKILDENRDVIRWLEEL